MKNLPIYSTRIIRNDYLLFLILILLTVFSFILSMCLGTVVLSPAQVAQSLFSSTGHTTSAYIVRLVRLPRTCGCLLAGGSLAVSGAIIQGVLANPLAAPNIIGVNSGAGLAVALCCAAAPTALALMPLAAFLGALTGVLLVLFISERTGASKITLVLAGVAVSNLFSACIDAIVTLTPDSLMGYSDFRIGGFSNLTMARISPAFWVIACCFIAAISLSNEMDILLLGTETAQSLGLPSKKFRLILLALAAALAGAAVSFSGLLGFVGLIVPHIMRRIAGEGSLVLLCTSALGGAVLLTLCDLLARVLFVPYELPVGIILSFVGGPFFIWLLVHQRRGRIHD